MKFNIETLKKKKHLYGIYLDSEKPEIIDFSIDEITFNTIFGYTSIIFTLSNNCNIWYTTIFDHIVNNEIHHNINIPFKSHLTNKKNWEPFNYKMYNFLFGFSKTTLKKYYIKDINSINDKIKTEIENLNNDINKNTDKINKLDELNNGIF